MASKNINVLLSLTDYFSAPIKKVGEATKDTTKKLNRAKNGLADFGARANSTFITAAKSVAAFGVSLAGLAVGGAIAGIKTLGSEGMALAEKQILAEQQLEAVLKNVTSIQARGADGVQKAATSLKAYAGELQNLGVIGDEVTLAGMAQLATFQMNDEQIKTVSASMLDLLAKTKGYNATQEDAVNIANMIGKAYTGNAGALSRVGITMTEEEKQAIKFGDANQRAAVIAKVLSNNVGGVNAAMAKTDVGRQTQAMNAYGDMLEEFGKKLLPVKADLWAAFGDVLPQVQSALLPVFDTIAKEFKAVLPDIKLFIVQLAKALPSAITITITTFKTAFPILKMVYNALVAFSPVIAGVAAGFLAFNVVSGVIKAFEVLSAVITLAKNATLLFNLAMSLNPLGLIAIAVAAVVAALVLLYQNWDKIVAYFGPTINAIKNWFVNAWNAIKTTVSNVWESIVASFNSCIDRLKGYWQDFKNFIAHPIDTIVNYHQRKMEERKDVPHNATGTSYFQGGQTYVNEGNRGELITLPSGSQIIPHDLAAETVQKSAPVINLNLTIAGNVIGNEDFYNDCGRVITDRIVAALANM